MKNERPRITIVQLPLFQTEYSDPLHSTFSPFYRPLNRQMISKLGAWPSHLAASMHDGFQKIGFIVNLKTPEKPPLFH